MTPGNAPSRRVTTTTPDTTPRTTLPRAENPASERRDELAQEFAQDGAYAYRFDMSEVKVNPHKPDFWTAEEIKGDVEAIENNVAAWTPEWLQNALMSAWQLGQLAGDSSAYHGGLYKEQNPFMTDGQRREWYGS